MLALFKQYPLLKEKIPHVTLGEFPTPVEKLKNIGQTIHTPQLYTKREDVSGKIYGGNKVRSAIHAGSIFPSIVL